MKRGAWLVVALVAGVGCNDSGNEQLPAQYQACTADWECKGDRICVEGKCTDPVPLPDMTALPDLVAPPDLATCGDGPACVLPGAESMCINGACVLQRCRPGFGDCDGKPDTGCELATSGDVNNCGACNTACPIAPYATAVCVAGVCGIGPCAAGRADCNGEVKDGCERNVQEDDLHCGGCGKVCPEWTRCTSATCMPCGGMGQPCCGSNPQQCGDKLVCNALGKVCN